MTKLFNQNKYYELTKAFTYPDCIEEALEDDCVLNPHLYTESTILEINTILLISPDITPDYILKHIRSIHNRIAKGA